MTVEQQRECFNLRRMRYSAAEIASAVKLPINEVRALLWPQKHETRPIIPRRYTETGRPIGSNKPRGLTFKRWSPVESMSIVWPLIREQWVQGKDMACVFANFEITPEEQKVCVNHLQQWFPRG